MNSNAIPDDWKNAIVVTIYKGGARSVVVKYRPVGLTSVVCNQMDEVTVGYVRLVWIMSGWLYEGHHDFKPGYSCERQVVTLCQNIVYSLDDGVRRETIIIDVFKCIRFSSTR